MGSGATWVRTAAASGVASNVPGAPVAELTQGREDVDAEGAIRAAFSLGSKQAATQDLEFAVRQLVEVAVRALSPGINDPFTAIAVLDRLGRVGAVVANGDLRRRSVIRRGDHGPVRVCCS